VGTKSFFPGRYGSSGVKLTNHPHLVLMLKMSEAITSTSAHAYVADTGTVLTFTWFFQASYEKDNTNVGTTYEEVT
jgi:hypothetical protein